MTPNDVTFVPSKHARQLCSRQVYLQQFLSRFDFQSENSKVCQNVADPISRHCSLYAMQARNFASPTLCVVAAQLHAMQVEGSKRDIPV